MVGPVALPGLNDANPVRQNTAIRQISERLEADYAPLDSPVFIGDPQAPTPDLADNDESVATTAYVQGQGYATTTYVDAENDAQDTALITALAGKSDVGHTHAESDITGLVADLAGKEPAIASGTTSQYWRGDKTWQAISQKLVGVYQSRYTSTTGLTTTFPNGVVVPSSTAGTQIISVSITTTTATQVVDCWFQTFGIASPSAFCSTGLYVGTTCFAATTTQFTGDASLIARYAPGAAGTYTFSVRIGPNTAATLSLNPNHGSAANTTFIAHVVEP